MKKRNKRMDNAPKGLVGKEKSKQMTSIRKSKGKR